eukprot:136062_1
MMCILGLFIISSLLPQKSLCIDAVDVLIGDYIKVKQSKSWTNANTYCQTRYGTELATIYNISYAEELYAIYTADEDNYWIGLNDRAGEGQYVYPDGYDCDLFDTFRCNGYWIPGQPDNLNNEDCAHMKDTVSKSAMNLLNDAPCTALYSFICNAPGIFHGIFEVKQANQCVDLNDNNNKVIMWECNQGTNQKWKYDSFTKTLRSMSNNKCVELVIDTTDTLTTSYCHVEAGYIKVKQAKSWTNANTYCQTEYGTELATIYNIRYAEQLYTIYKADEDNYWIGLNDRAGEGQYVYPDGYECDQNDPSGCNGYWILGQPDNLNNEDCAHMKVSNSDDATNLLNDAPCTALYSFICNAPGSKVNTGSQEWEIKYDSQLQTNQIKSLHIDKCFVNDNGLTTSTCDNTIENQQWEIRCNNDACLQWQVPDVSYTLNELIEITSTKNNKCVDLDRNNNKLLTWECHQGNNQIWKYDSFTKQLISMDNNKCVELVIGTTDSLTTSNCHIGWSQRWEIKYDSQLHTNQLKSLGNNKCLNLIASNDELTTSTCDNVMDNQQWAIRCTNLVTIIKFVANNMCLELLDKNDGYLYLITAVCNGAGNQQWVIKFEADGVFTLQSVYNDKCIEYEVAYSRPRIADCTGNNNQKWRYNAAKKEIATVYIKYKPSTNDPYNLCWDVYRAHTSDTLSTMECGLEWEDSAANSQQWDFGVASNYCSDTTIGITPKYIDVDIGDVVCLKAKECGKYLKLSIKNYYKKVESRIALTDGCNYDTTRWKIVGKSANGIWTQMQLVNYNEQDRGLYNDRGVLRADKGQLDWFLWSNLQNNGQCVYWSGCIDGLLEMETCPNEDKIEVEIYYDSSQNVEYLEFKSIMLFGLSAICCLCVVIGCIIWLIINNQQSVKYMPIETVTTMEKDWID